MTEDDAFGMFGSVLNGTDENAGGARRNESMLRNGRIDRRNQVSLDVQSLWAILLDKIHILQRLTQVQVEAETIPRCSLTQPNLFQCRPIAVDQIAETILSSVRRVARDDIKAASEKIGCPTGADDACSDDANAFHFVVLHTLLSFPFCFPSLRSARSQIRSAITLAPPELTGFAVLR